MCSPAKLEKSAFEELSMSDRQLICSSLIHCINWFRELVRDSHNNDKNLMSGQFGHLIKCVGGLTLRIKSPPSSLFLKVSSFASESDKEMNWKVLMRIRDICSLQEKLKSLLTGTHTRTKLIQRIKSLFYSCIYW